MDRDPITHLAPSADRRRGSTFAKRLALPVAAALLIAGCSTSPPGEGGPVTVAPNVTIAPFPTVAPFPTGDRPTPADPAISEPTTAALATATPQATATPGSTVTPAPTDVAAFPVMLTDDEGTQVTIPAEPQHIISLSPSNTEIAFALGVGDRVVGGTDADDYPAEAAAIPDVVSQTKILMEKIVEAEPDLVLANGQGFTPPADIARMRELGYPVLVLYPPTVDAALGDIRLVGRAVGEPETAETITADMAERIEAIEAIVGTATIAPRTFYEIGYFDKSIYAPAPDSVYANEVEVAGGDPITTGDATAFDISLEKLIQADPEVIVLGDALYGTCPADVAKRAGWKVMTAVKEDAVRPVNDTLVTRPGPRLPAGLASLARAIHPELQFPDEPPDPPMCEAG